MTCFSLASRRSALGENTKRGGQRGGKRGGQAQVLFAWHPGEVRLVKTPSAAADAAVFEAAKSKCFSLGIPGGALGENTKRGAGGKWVFRGSALGENTKRGGERGGEQVMPDWDHTPDLAYTLQSCVHPIPPREVQAPPSDRHRPSRGLLNGYVPFRDSLSVPYERFQ